MKTRMFALTLSLLLLCTACGKAPAESAVTPPERSASEPGIISSSGSDISSIVEESEEAFPPEQSASSEKSSQDAVPSIAETASAQPPDTSGDNLFQVGKDEIYDLYLYHPGQLAYGMLGAYFYSPRPEPDHPIIEALNELPPLKKIEPNPGEQVQTGFLIIREGYEKTQINLYERKIETAGTFYELTAEQYDKLKKLADEAPAEIGLYGFYAQWLVWMNPNRVTGIECTDETGRTFQIKSENISLAALEPRYIAVSGGKTYASGSKDFTGMKNAFQTVITFDSGVTYTMVLENDNLYLESSDMDLACQYKTSKTAEYFIDSMKNAEKGIMNPRTAKPVIYLYPERVQDVSVRLHFRGEISYTYPAYNGGWNVTAAPDGTLTNKADGSTHYYLFWDGTSDFRNWDFSEGFVVKGSEVENFFKETLPAMGLTPREYNDFITYWTPEMSRNEYNLVAFPTAQYQAVAQLDIAPVPDTVLRVHMVYKPIPEPVAIKEPVLPKAIVRKGFTVVEWGGTRAG